MCLKICINCIAKVKVVEIRNVDTGTEALPASSCDGSAKGCGTSGCSGNGMGCNGSTDVTSKVDKIKDCRCIVCKKIGFQAQKQLERKAISVFDIEGGIDEILDKIIEYYRKLDQRRLKQSK